MNDIIHKLGHPVGTEVKIAAVTRLKPMFRGKPGLGNGRKTPKTKESEVDNPNKHSKSPAQWKIKVGHLHVCGWTVSNNLLSTKIVEAVDANMFSVCETNLIASDNLHINGYIWKSRNRQHIRRDAQKDLGGVGLLVKQWILNDFNFKVVDASFDSVSV
ncbi:unnamed protein product [Mytilus coruscus]|uniref:Uncharacterized protein n=1 Tax=Mytilus coruscus TaxID=42192 RepID=A0A6J8EDN6_MYTCO|nr:unnamed protein product [Mytilus coruscus]